MSQRKIKITVVSGLCCLLVFVGVELVIRWRIEQFDKAHKPSMAELWSMHHPADQKQPYEIRDISDPAAYEFYSSIFMTAGLYRPGETIAIFLGQMPFVPSFHCDRPLPEEEQTMIEMSKANDRIARNWKRQFGFNQPYFLVPPLDFFRARNCVMSMQGHHPLPGCEPYAHVSGLLYLSIPVFNSDHSKVLVTVERVSFDDKRPDDGFLKIFRKTAHGWTPDPHGLAGCKWSFLTDQ